METGKNTRPIKNLDHAHTAASDWLVCSVRHAVHMVHMQVVMPSRQQDRFVHLPLFVRQREIFQHKKSTNFSITTRTQLPNTHPNTHKHKFLDGTGPAPDDGRISSMTRTLSKSGSTTVCSTYGSGRGTFHHTNNTTINTVVVCTLFTTPSTGISYLVIVLLIGRREGARLPFLYTKMQWKWVAYFETLYY